MTTKKQFDVALYLQALIIRQEDSRNSYDGKPTWTIRITPVILGNEYAHTRDENPDFTKVTNPPDSRDYNGLFLNGLEIIARGEEREEGRTLWHHEYRFDVYKVDRMNAHRISKTIKTIDARLEKIAARDGYAKDFVDFVRRISEALKITQFVQPANDRSGFYSDTTHRFLPKGEGLNLLTHAIWRWVQEPIEKKQQEEREREQREGVTND